MIALLATLMVGAVEPRELPIPKDAVKLREQGLAAYKRKDYPGACALFEKASVAAPDSPEILADLGLCRLKTEQKEASIEIGRRAARLARTWKLRKGIYYNLASAGAALPLPKVGSCGDLTPGPQCNEALRACKHAYSCRGMKITTVGTGLVVSHPEKGLLEHPEAPTSCDDPVRNDGSNWADSIPIGPKSSRADIREVEVRSGDPTRLADHDILIDESFDEGAEKPRTETTCVVVDADACNGRVGVVCKWEPRGAKPSVLVHEFWLVTPQSHPSGD